MSTIVYLLIVSFRTFSSMVNQFRSGARKLVLTTGDKYFDDNEVSAFWVSLEPKTEARMLEFRQNTFLDRIRRSFGEENSSMIVSNWCVKTRRELVYSTSLISIRSTQTRSWIANVHLMSESLRIESNWYPLLKNCTTPRTEKWSSLAHSKSTNWGFTIS